MSLDSSLTRYVGRTGYDLNQLRDDLHRFAFLLGNDGQALHPLSRCGEQDPVTTHGGRKLGGQ